MPTDPASISSSSTTSLPTRSSPKRKRDNVQLSSSPLKGSPLRVTTNASSLAQTPGAHGVEDLTQSPRSRVATRFSDMEITPVSLNNTTTTTGAAIAPPRKLDFKADPSPLSQSIGGRAKKQRTSLASAKEIPETPRAREVISEGVHKLADIGRAEVGLEMDEQNSTPLGDENSPTAKRKKQPTEMKVLVDSSSSIEPIQGRSAIAVNGVKSKKGPPVRTKSPPIPYGKAVWIDSPPNKPHLSKAPELVDMMESNHDDNGGSSDVEPSSLHWDDSEITGHDPSDPEDDGEGINGIGFKPTAAMARDRSERRRRQLEQYKKREDAEARAARAKRSEARRRAMMGEEDKAKEDAEARRVRFAEKERAMDVL